MSGRTMTQQRIVRRKWKKMPRIRRDQCFVYFISARVGNSELVKIGFTTVCVRQRCQMLQLGSPVELNIMGFFHGIQQDEIDLHQRFKHLHSHREWFHLGDDLRDEIAALCIERAA